MLTLAAAERTDVDFALSGPATVGRSFVRAAIVFAIGGACDAGPKIDCSVEASFAARA